MILSTIESKQNRFLYYCISFGSLLFIVSSGMSGSLRLLGASFIIFSFIIQVFKYDISFPRYILAACIAFCLTFAIGVIRTTLLSNDHSEIYSLTILLIILFPIVLAVYSTFGSIYMKDVVNFISWSYVIIFFILFFSLILLRQVYGANILLFLSNYSGGFYYRSLGSISNYPLIWFQWSILAMPLAVFQLYSNKKWLFFFLSLVVFLSLNRTGSFLVIIFYLFSLLKNKKRISKFFLYFMFMLPLVFLIGCFIIHAVYSQNFTTEGTGFEIRLGHVISVVDNLYVSDNFFWGMGADSLFATLGRETAGLVRNQEISFLEILRRFGIIGYILFNFGLSISLLFFYNRSNWPAFYSLLVYIIFSFTNPSLISLIFIIFYAIISSTGERLNTRDNYHI